MKRSTGQHKLYRTHIGPAKEAACSNHIVYMEEPTYRPTGKTMMGAIKLHIENTIGCDMTERKPVVLCKNCDYNYIKWASKEEYLWYQLKQERGERITFNQLFWASRYDSDYRAVLDFIKKENIEAEEIEAARVGRRKVS